MSEKLPAILEPTEQDIALLLAAKCHLGTKNVHNDMKKYTFTRRSDGIFLIHIGKLWEKLILAARVIVYVHPEDIYITSSSYHGRRPASKISTYLGGAANCGRFPPGTFTKSIADPTLLICMDPRDDFQAIKESSKCSIPVITFANSHSSLKFVDIAIPCNNIGSQSIGVMCWLLTRAVLRLRGALKYEDSWKVIPDMFFYNEDDLAHDEEDEVVARYDNTGGGAGNWQESNTNNFDSVVDWTGNQGFSNDTTTGDGGWQSEVQSAPVISTSLWSGNNNTFGSNDRTFDLEQFTTPATNIDWADEDPTEEDQPTTDERSAEEVTQIAPPTDSLGWGSPAPSSNTNPQWNSMKPSWN